MRRWNRSAVTWLMLVAVVLVVGLVPGCPQQVYEQPSTTATTGGQGEDGRVSYPDVIRGLQSPIAMAFAPDGRIFITERTGRIRIFEDGRLLGEPFATVDVPSLQGYHETGLLGIALSQNFQDEPYVYAYHTYERDNRLFNRVVRFRADGGSPSEPEVVVDGIPGGRIHNGGILAFGPDDNLYISTGETGDGNLAQDRGSVAGKILRVTPQGDVPGDNPFPNSPVYSLGHRNVFGMAFHPETGVLYITENGPVGDDEINRIEAGDNYGWPIVTGSAGDSRFTDPIRTYDRSIAPTQAIFYTGDLIEGFENRFIFGTYNAANLRAIELSGPQNARVDSDRVVYEAGQPVVGVSQSPDGAIYTVGTSVIRRVERLRR